MSARRASLVDAHDARQCVTAALRALTERRADADAPLDYARRVRNPWTRDLAIELALEIDHTLTASPADAGHRHEVSALMGPLTRALPEMQVRLAEGGPYPVNWRIYADDDSAMLDQPAVICTQWRGLWPHLSRACDDLSQAGAGLKVLVTQADPTREVDGLSLATACAYRLSAYAHKGDPMLLAFYGGAEGWRETAGFTLYGYVAGERALTPLDVE